MTDEAVRSAVLDFLAGTLPLDDLEEIALDHLAGGSDATPERVLHVVSTSEQFSSQELRDALRDIANNVHLMPPALINTDSASVTSVLDLRAPRFIAKHVSWDLAGRSREVAPA